EYTITIALMCINTRGGDENCADGSSGFPDAHQMLVLIDGARAKTFEFESLPRRDRYAGDAGTVDGQSAYAEAQRLDLRLPGKAGPHEIGVTFRRLPPVETIQRTYQESFTKPFSYRGVDRGMQVTVPHLSRVTIEGPFHPTGVADTPSRRAIFVCRPSSAN